MSVGGIVGFTYLFTVLISMRVAYRILASQIEDFDKEDMTDRMLGTLLAFMAAWIWPIGILYVWMAFEMPSPGTLRARRRARIARALARAEEELADANRAVERAKRGY